MGAADITPKQWKKLSPYLKLVELAKVSDECADRCEGNMLFAKTWIQISFQGLADRLREMAHEVDILDMKAGAMDLIMKRSKRVGGAAAQPKR